MMIPFTPSVREDSIEEHFRKRVIKAGGFSYKFTVPGRRHVPDRIMLLPGICMQFVELKKPGEKPTEGQLREHARILEWSGFPVLVWDATYQIDSYLSDYEIHAPRISGYLQ